MEKNCPVIVEGHRSFIFPSQRTQWLTSALSHAYGRVPQSNIVNEIIVLSTGIDQFIQEVFFHLASMNPQGDGYRGDADVESEVISSEDFKILCRCLGAEAGRSGRITGCGLESSETVEIGFQDFHARLIELFSNFDDDDSEEGKEVVNIGGQNRWRSDEEVVEAGITIPDRHGLVLRQMCTECFQQRSLLEVFHSLLFKQGKTVKSMGANNNENTETLSTNTSEHVEPEDCMSILARNEEVAILRAENNCLREVVEDMRRALQSCDARCLAMLVEQKKLQQNIGVHQIIEKCRERNKNLVFSETESSRVFELERELIRVRDDRDKQLEEAILFTQQLEVELWQEKQKNEAPERFDKGVDTTMSPNVYIQDIASPTLTPDDEGEKSPCDEGKQIESGSESTNESTSDDDSIITSIPSGDWCFPNSGDDFSPVTRVNIANLEIEMKEVKETLRQVEFERDTALEKVQQLAIDLDVETRGRKLDRRRYLDDIDSLVSDRERFAALEEELGDVIVLIMRLRDMNVSKRSVGKIIFDVVNESNKERYDLENVAESFIHNFHKELLHCDPAMTNGNMNTSQSSTSNGNDLSRKNGVSLKNNFYQFHGDENIEEELDSLKRPSGFPVDLIKSGFEMKC